MLKKWIALSLAVCLLLCGCTPVGDDEENTTTASQTETNGQDLAAGAEDAIGEGETTPTQGAVSDETKPKEEPQPSQPEGDPVPPDAVEPPASTTNPPQSTEPPAEETTTPAAPDDSIELPDDDWT